MSAPYHVVSVGSMAEEEAYPEEGIRFDTWKAQAVTASASGIGIIPGGHKDGLAPSEQLNGTGVTAYSCHPVVVTTELGR